MKLATSAALLVAALLVACFVERPSDSFKCSTQADCMGLDGNRVCTSGFCVVPNCPSDCTTCDEAKKTCLAECTSSTSCGQVTCPSGWTCTINCTGGNACADVDCAAGSTCIVTCSGTDACETVDCGAACACDLTCATGACNAPNCPTVGNGANLMRCTTDGTQNANCDSAHAAGCTRC
jgi:hypothetical protein